jgi:hypothetical protein
LAEDSVGIEGEGFKAEEKKASLLDRIFRPEIISSLSRGICDRESKFLQKERPGFLAQGRISKKLMWAAEVEAFYDLLKQMLRQRLEDRKGIEGLLRILQLSQIFATRREVEEAHWCEELELFEGMCSLGGAHLLCVSCWTILNARLGFSWFRRFK